MFFFKKRLQVEMFSAVADFKPNDAMQYEFPRIR